MNSSDNSRFDAPFASILIPTYRRADLVRDAVEVCLQQAADIGEAIEIVVVDNCPGKSAESTVAQYRDRSTMVRYVHEPRTGVAFARNAAVREARGRFIIFLDDDQRPQEGWLSAFIKAGKSGAKAAFGPLTPIYDVPPAKHAKILNSMFSRQLPVRDGDEIGAFYPYLGTGNSLFDKKACFPSGDAFDIRFNTLGGEDVWMLKGLRARDIPFVWAAGAYVLESVPTGRMTSRYLVKRKFQSGQIRALLTFHPMRRRPLAAFLWMAAGAAQVTVHGARYLFASLFQRSRADDFLIRAAGGAGKVFWFKASTGDAPIWRSSALSS